MPLQLCVALSKRFHWKQIETQISGFVSNRKIRYKVNVALAELAAKKSKIEAKEVH